MDPVPAIAEVVPILTVPTVTAPILPAAPDIIPSPVTIKTKSTVLWYVLGAAAIIGIGYFIYRNNQKK